MAAVYCMSLGGLLLLGLSIGMFFGKFSFLISGYNMMPPEEKAKYNERKLCRCGGPFCWLFR